MSFRDAPPNAPRIALRIENDVPCPDCGYNLRGLRLDGRCPECGRPTIDTFARPLRAKTGVLAEEMIRRPGVLLVGLLAWWVIASTSVLAPPVVAQFIVMAATVVIAPPLLITLARMVRVLRAAQSRPGGSSRPLRDIAGLWFTLGGLAVLPGGALMGLTLFWPSELPLFVRQGLILAACASAAASQLLAARGAITVLRRLALRASGVATPVMAGGIVGLVIACLVPVAGGLFVSLRILAGSAAAIIWLVASYRLVNSVREAQGSVVSIGRSTRR